MPPVARRPRIALIGCGAWGRNLARVLLRIGCLTRIYDASALARAQAQLLCPGIVVLPHYDPNANTDFEAVVVATPASMHAPCVTQALAAGKDVFVEKPMTLCADEALALTRKAAEQGCILMVGHLLLYHPAMAMVRHIVATQILGPLRQIVCTRHQFGTIRHEEDVLWSLGPHDLSLLIHLAQSTPTHLRALGHAFVQPGVCDTCVVHLSFATGLQATINLSWLHPRKEQRLIVQGSHGALIFDDVQKSLHLQPLSVVFDADGRPLARRAPQQLLAFDPQEPLEMECQAFVAAIRSRQAPASHGAHGVQVVRLLQAAQTSLRRGGACVDIATVAPTAGA